MSEPTSVCPVCSAEQPDALLCSPCTKRLMGCLRMLQPHARQPLPAPKHGKLVGSKHMPVRELWPRGTAGHRQQLPWETPTEGWTGLGRELEVSYARQGQRGSGIGGKSADTAVPFDQSATEARDALRNTLTTWVRELWYGQVKPDGRVKGEPLPKDTVAAMAAWLSHRKERIRGHEAVAEIWNDIVGAVEFARRVIDSRPTLEFVGPCEICGAGDVYAAANSDNGVCRHCAEHVEGISAMRKRNAEYIENLCISRRELLPALIDVWGYTIKAGTLHKWVQRGQLKPAAYRFADLLEVEGGEIFVARTHPEPLFRVREVLDLVVALRAKAPA